MMGDFFLKEEARSGAAGLALVGRDGIYDALNHTVQVGVIKYDEGGFTTQLEREFFARACCGTAERATNIGRTGEGNLVYAGMEHEGITDLRGFTRQDVDHARRQADLLYYLGKFE